MTDHSIPFTIDSMRVPDIPDCIAIEQAAYFPANPQRDYAYEIEHNRIAHYFVLRFHPQAHLNATATDLSATIIGVGGFWLMADELHIITIATHPKWQRLGLGEWLLLALLEEGQTMGSQHATLEVRPSNTTAIALYQKHNFQEVGRRSTYYGDNGEDALILTTPSFHVLDYQAMLTQRKTKLLKRLAQIKMDKNRRTN